jgi:hypothetical protein
MKFYQIRSVHVFLVMLFAIVRVCICKVREKYNGCQSLNFFEQNIRKSKKINPVYSSMEYLLRYRHPPNKPHPLNL